MKGSLSRTALLLLLAAAFTITPGCKDAREQARQRLEKQGIAMTPAELIRASGSGKEDVVRAFIEAGYDLNVSNFSDAHNPLTAAVAGRHEGVVRMLLEGGANVNGAGPHGNTPLMLAINDGNLSLAKLLLENNADTGIENAEEFRALELAAFRGSPEMVRLVAPKAKSQLNRALHVACVVADAPTVAALLESGADVNALMQPNNRTPLMMSAEHGKLDVARVLTQHRADPTARDVEGKTAAMLAMENRYQDVATLILERQNDPGYQPISAQDAPRVFPQGTDDPAQVVDVAGTPPDAISAQAAEAELLADVQGQAPTAIASEAEEQASTARTQGAVGAATASPLLQQLRQKLSVNDRKESASPSPSSPIAETATANGPIPMNSALAPASETPQTSAAVQHDAAAMVQAEPAATRQQPTIVEAVEPAHLPLRLNSVRRETLPLRYTGGSGGSALVEVGGQGGAVHKVRKGQTIPGMNYRVLRIASRRSQDKFGDWHDASTLYLEDVQTMEKLALVKNLEAESPNSGATLTTEVDGKVLEVTRGQTFTLPNQPDRQFVLEDVRQDQVVLQEVSTGEMYTVGR